MASNDPELKDTFSLPVWMKSRPSNSKEFDTFASSPPAPEDNFYIRYPKADTLFGKTKLEQDLPKLVIDSKELLVSQFNPKERDWSKHTKPCQEVLHGIAPINTAANSATSKPKSAGVDDGFKGEGAACGTSIVKVAHQMISTRGGSSPRGYTVAAPTDDAPISESEIQHYNLMARRGSKSLPTTPVHSPPSSPNSRRRKAGNRYFTSPFEPVEDGSSRSWLTMALLGFKKDLAASTSTLAEEDAIDARLQGGTLAESVENLGPAPRAKDLFTSETTAPTQQPKLAKPAHAFRPKPSELREMNFWSPTSM